MFLIIVLGELIFSMALGLNLVNGIQALGLDPLLYVSA